MNIETALKHAMDGNAILFLGAGFSSGGINKLNKKLPTAKELSYLMCDELKIQHSADLAIISERFIEDHTIGQGLEKFIQFLKQQLICAQTTEVQDCIANLPWMRIYTTNYDNVFEISSKKMKINREVITATLSKERVNDLTGAIVHMNGNITNVNSEKFYNEFKITNENYLRQGFLDSQWGDQFVSDINNCKTIIFVGYSLKYDLDLQKIMHDKIYDKAIFIDRKDIDSNQEYLFNKWGNFYPIEANGLAFKINEMKCQYVPRENTQRMQGIKEIVISNYKNREIFANDVLNLLVYGKYNTYDFRNSSEFYLKRVDVLKSVTDILQSKKICLIHSNLGNGKSIVLQYLASQLVEENNIFYLENTSNIQQDLNIIEKNKSTTSIILVDDYDLHLMLFKELSYNFPDNIKVIATCRTSVSDILLDRLENEFGFKTENIGVVNIEIISDKERKNLISLLDRYNFWGSNSTLSPSEKDKLINKKYKNRLSSIFYMLLDSNVISDKLQTIFTDIKNEEVKKYLLAQSICDISNFKLKGYEIARLANIDYFEIEKASLSTGFKEVFQRTADDIELRSTIFSQYLIRKNEEYNNISKLLTDIYINSFKSYNKEYNIIRKKLISRSNLIEIFGGKKKNESWEKRDSDIYKFYGTIREYSKDNPFFWLQYGITALNLKNYVEAKIYFQNAYSYAAELENFDCFQLDTHYARFLLSEIAECDKEFDFKKFEQAHRLLMDNSNAEVRLSYVLRQVGVYYDIEKRYKDLFTSEERLRYIEEIKEIVERFKVYFRAIERKKGENFYFAIDKPVRGAYKKFRQILVSCIPESDLKSLDDEYNKLVKKTDRVRTKI